MPAGIGGAGYMAFTFETTMGTYLDPSTAGTLFIPILSETLTYQEDKYYSEQIRQSTIASEQKPGYYHVGGDVVLEVDSSFLPYLMYISRHTITKTGAGPYSYKFAPSSAGAASTAASGAVQRTASITIIRNGVGFGYAGCVCGQYEFTIDGGNLRLTMSILGLGESDPGSLGTPAWVAAKLLGADAHSIFVAAAGTAPTFSAADVSFNGFTFTANYNAEAQNRIVANRQATYIRYAQTEATYSTELDFLTKGEYTNMKNSTKRAIKLESIGDAVSFATSADAVQIQVNNSVYDTYEPNIGGMSDLIMANVTGRALGIAGGDAYAITVKSTANIS